MIDPKEVTAEVEAMQAAAEKKKKPTDTDYLKALVIGIAAVDRQGRYMREQTAGNLSCVKDWEQMFDAELKHLHLQPSNSDADRAG